MGPGETLLSESAGRRAADLALLSPKALLYAINARIGGYGLDLNAHEALKLSFRGGFLGEAIAYANRQDEIAPVRSLQWHPVRLLSFLESPFYYAAKKRALDQVASSRLATGKFDLFHSWEGDCLNTLRLAKKLGIPSVLEIPTWHRDKGKQKPRDKVEISRHEAEAGIPEKWFTRLLISRQETLEEYDLADLLLVPSECSARTFEAAGISRDKLFMLGAGADVSRFRANDPGRIPQKFSESRPMRAIYCGALIRRKGVHVLLAAWRKAALPHATLTLVGAIHPEIMPSLEEHGGDGVRAVGFTRDVEKLFQEADLHVFPSECEGSAKTVYEACAAGLPQITTFESGDVVQHGGNGLIVPCRDVEALASALEEAYERPEKLREFSVNARQRAESHLTWDHFRQRLAQAYDRVLRRSLTKVP